MYSNIGTKIKLVAVLNAILGMLASIVFGGVVIAFSNDSYIFDEEELTIVGVGIIILGMIASWVLSFVLYGFGRLIENSEDIANYIRQGGKFTAQQSFDDSEAFKAAKEMGIEFTKNAYAKGAKIVSDTAQKIADKTANKQHTGTSAYPQGVPSQTNSVAQPLQQTNPVQSTPIQNINRQAAPVPKSQNNFCPRCGRPISQCVCGMAINADSAAVYDDVFSKASIPAPDAEKENNKDDFDDFIKEFNLL